jgi:hypothetical protein
MSHGVYDERGQLILTTGSEMRAFLLALDRQTQGKLTTVLIGGSAEVLFAPTRTGTQNAETAVELEARMAARQHEALDLLPTHIRRKYLTMDYKE